MCYSSHFKDTLTLENQPFFKKIEILISDTHQPFSPKFILSSLHSTIPVKAAYLHREKFVTWSVRNQ